MTLADKAREALADATPGPWDGRAVYDDGIGLPLKPCLFAAISPSAGIETARVWNLADARLIALAPDLARAVLAAEELADAVNDWDDAVNADTGGADEADEMLRALTAYRKAMDHQS
jgi:hypothetical protein